MTRVLLFACLLQKGFEAQGNQWPRVTQQTVNHHIIIRVATVYGELPPHQTPNEELSIHFIITPLPKQPSEAVVIIISHLQMMTLRHREGKLLVYDHTAFRQ